MQGNGSWRSAPSGFRTALYAGLVCLCCYVGSVVDTAIDFPRIKTAILFPPYAVLTAALLLSPAHHWWVYLLAAFAGCYFPHRHGGAPVTFVLLTEGVNYLRALVAAGGVRYCCGGAPRFDTLRGMSAFLLFAVFLAPLTAAFAGAGAVMLHRNAGFVSLDHGLHDFWLVWEAWFFSNALTGLTLLPMLVIGLTRVRGWVRRVSPQEGVEAVLLGLGLLCVGGLVFSAPYAGQSGLPARLYAPLPFLLWAAVRFGPSGASASLFVLTLLTVWGALRGQGPFVVQSPAENLLSLQLFLLAISLPLMFLAALIEERRQTAAALHTSFEQIQNLAGRLITAQEVERSRIARQLHDGINQQIAALSIALSNLKRRLAGGEADLEPDLVQIQEQTIHLAEEIRQLSHELHPEALQHVGLVAALLRYCRDFGSQHNLAVSFADEAGPEPVRADLALCLYRVAQEALHNVAAHARARHVQVTLARKGEYLELSVHDDGRGFDPAEVRQVGGLGLVSIEERVRLVGGRVRIESSPQDGTTLHVHVPHDGSPSSTPEPQAAPGPIRSSGS